MSLAIPNDVINFPAAEYVDQFGTVMFIPQLQDGIILTMPQGGAILYSKRNDAEYHARMYKRGYHGGAIEARKEDVI